MRAPALVGEGARPVAGSLRSRLRQCRSGLGSLCGQCGQDGEGVPVSRAVMFAFEILTGTRSRLCIE